MDSPWHLAALGLDEEDVNPSDTSAFAPVVVALLDSGIDATRDDLRGQVIAAWEARGGVHELPAESNHDLDGHGTSIAALIASQEPSIGVAPRTRFLSLRFDTAPVEGHSAMQQLITLLEYLVLLAPQCQLAVMAFTFDDPDSWLLRVYHRLVLELRERGILAIAGVGNYARADDGEIRYPAPETEPLVYPAAFPEILAVGAVSANGTSCAFSRWWQFPIPKPDLVAAGEAVYTRTGVEVEPEGGTSLAAALVAGVAALVLERNPRVSVERLTEILLAACERLPDVPDEQQGAGRLWAPTAIHQSLLG